MKIDDFDIKKWWHWLAVVFILALLILLAFSMAPAIMCWSYEPVQNISTSDYVTSSSDNCSWGH